MITDYHNNRRHLSASTIEASLNRAPGLRALAEGVSVFLHVNIWMRIFHIVAAKISYKSHIMGTYFPGDKRLVSTQRTVQVLKERLKERLCKSREYRF